MIATESLPNIAIDGHACSTPYTGIQEGAGSGLAILEFWLPRGPATSGIRMIMSKAALPKAAAFISDGDLQAFSVRVVYYVPTKLARALPYVLAAVVTAGPAAVADA